MKGILHKISIIAFMLYYIVIASGVNIKLHYCEGEISDFAVYSNNAHCNMQDETPCGGGSCGSHTNTIETKHMDLNKHCEVDQPMHCCSNKDVYFAINTILNFSSKNFEIKDSEIDLINITDSEDIAINEINGFDLINNSLHHNYPPPYLEFQQLLVYS